MSVTSEISVVTEVNGDREKNLTIWIYLLFFSSGIPAIIYQIVWQRALFALYGINVESVTIVVSAFMLGLGLGGLAGGRLSQNKNLPPVALFGGAELAIAIFALISLPLFQFVTEYTRAQPLWVTGTISFLLVVIPTTLMGSTLPLLIEHLVRISQNVGSSVGSLYFVNTLGSGVACLIAVRPLMNTFGQAGTVRCGALLNALVGAGALAISIHCERKDRNRVLFKRRTLPTPSRLLPFALALFCAAFCGFTALSYEIIWYRLLTFAVGDTAPTFVSLLGSYLVGIALGARLADGYTERHRASDVIRALPIAILGSSIVSFWINPASAFVLKVTPGGFFVSLMFLLLVCHAAILFGALFPLIAHVAVEPRRVGTSVSYLYAANIAGSTLGVLLVGFVLMDKFPLYQIALGLLIGGVLCAVAVFLVSTRTHLKSRVVLATACVTLVFLASFSHPVFATIYDRLLFKKLYPSQHFDQVIENRSGTIGVTPDGTLYGGGVYDGAFNTDLLNDTNIIARPYALSAFHEHPSHVLMIGLGSGSWAQVVANNPLVHDLTVVEINRGYLDAISKHRATESLLRNPKVTIVIDDGRRWLLRHPEASFDAVIMNTSYYWRNHVSDLLSTEFLDIVRSHLRIRGVFFYNTTWSDDVMATGLAVYPYALRIFNCLVLSDSPLILDRARWKSVLLSYAIDGKKEIDSDDPNKMKKLDNIVEIRHAAPAIAWASIEEDQEIRQRLRGRQWLIITDDNMGLEWR